MIIKLFLRHWFVLLLVAGLFFAHDVTAHSIEKSQTSLRPKISIVVDDLGDNSIIAKKMLSLPGKLTAAILPNTPHAKSISHFANSQGHDIIMHLPMEAFTRPDLLGPGALFANMDKSTFSSTFNLDAASIPHIIGFNNHMGSLLTENKEKMRWLMDQAKSNHLFFLDSKTSEDSIAEYIALKKGVPTISRDVFLDHNKQEDALLRQFNLSKTIAKRKGRVVIICHPYPETLAFLQSHLDSLNEEFELVGLSELLSTPKLEVIQPFVAR